MRPRLYALDAERIVRRDIENIEIIRIEIIVVLRVCRSGGDHLADGFRTCVRQELKNGQSFIDTKPFDSIGDQAHFARRNANTFCNSPDLHFTPLYYPFGNAPAELRCASAE